MSAEKYIAKTILEMPPSGIRKFFDIASEMKDAISLGVGEPDFVTPWNIREMAIYALESGKTHYTSNHGLLELRELVAKYLKDRFSLEYHVEEMLITVGASEALDLAFRTLIEPGDEVLVPAPSYVSYMPGVKFAGGIPVPIATKEENNFKILKEDIEAVVTPKTKAIVLPYPNNPTGAIMEKKDLEGILDTILRHDLFVISDEIYAELTYGKDHVSVASFPEIKDRTVVINGFSKAFAMTGFRLGYGAGPKPVIDAMVKIHQYTMLCAPIISQIAGVEALKYEIANDYIQVKVMARQYNRRRQLIHREFNRIGFHCFEPEGAFYCFPNITSTGLSSEAFCTRLIREKKIACVPGTAFGDGGEGFIRCSYASSLENIVEALRRIKEFAEELKHES